MSNEDLVKLIKALGELGFRVVRVSPEVIPSSPLNPEGHETLRTTLLISPNVKA
jgi:hypothetical protein